VKYRLIWTLLFLVSLDTKLYGQETKILSNGDEILVESPMQVQISYPHGDPSPSFTLYRGNYKVDDWIIKRIQMPADKQESLRWKDYTKNSSIDGIEIWANAPQTVSGDNVNLQEQTLYRLTSGLTVYLPGEEGTTNRHVIQQDGVYWITKAGDTEGIIGPFKEIPPQYR